MLLRSIAASKGLDCVHYALAFADYFGPGFEGYRDVSTKGFLRNYARGVAPPATGAPDAQANCVARLAPLVAGWGGSKELMHAVERATRVTQNSDAACAWGCAGAAVLERVVLGSAPSAAVWAAIAELEQAHAEWQATSNNNSSSQSKPTSTSRYSALLMIQLGPITVTANLLAAQRSSVCVFMHTVMLLPLRKQVSTAS